MAISDRTRKILWGKAGGRCSTCRELLVVDGTETDDPSVIGEEAHIISEAADGPRHANLAEYDVYDNLILLCRNHHKPADDHFRRYSVDELKRIKREHEAWVARQTSARRPKLIPDPTRPAPKRLQLCMTATAVLDVMQDAHSFHTSWPANLSEEQRDLIAEFCDALRDWRDVMSMEDSFKVGRDAAKDLSGYMEALTNAGIMIGARYRHCLLTGGEQEPTPWGAVDIQFHPLSQAQMVDEGGVQIWPPPHDLNAEEERPPATP